MGTDTDRQYGYVPFAALDTSSTGRQTREGSRTLEYAFEDFSIRQVALLLNQTDIEAEYANRSLVSYIYTSSSSITLFPTCVPRLTVCYLHCIIQQFYRNVWDPSVKSDGFKGFMQKRFMNGSFAHTNPVDCSPNDNDTSRECSLQEDNETGFYEVRTTPTHPHDIIEVDD